MKLSQDVKSLFNHERVYGQKGDAVKVISYHGSVAIVETISRDRFPVMVLLLTNSIIKEINNGELSIPAGAHRMEEKPSKKLRVKKGNKVHRSTSADAGATLF